jgi:hypothetical protein
MDDRQSWRIIRARVAFTGEDKKISSCVLLLGVHRVSGVQTESTLQDLDQDYGAQVVQATETVLRKICNDRDDLLQSVRRKILLLCGDGCPALQKALRLHVQDLLPAVALIVRDGCHAVRIATKEPLRTWPAPAVKVTMLM